MNKPIIVFAVAAMTCLLAAGQPEGGCEDGALPSAKQVELNIPPELFNCPGLPKSPGDKATQQQTAVYIVELYNAAIQCSKNNKAAGRIVKRYEAQVEKLKQYMNYE